MSKAVGRKDAPLLVVMVSEPSEKMWGWFWRILYRAGIRKTDVRVVFMIDGQPKGRSGPLVTQYRSARKRYEREIAASSPSVVMPMEKACFYSLTGINEPIFDARGYVIRREMFQNMPHEVYRKVGVYKGNSRATGAKKGDPKWKWVTESRLGLLGPDFTGVVIPTFSLDHIRESGFALKPAFKEDVLRIARALNDDLREIDRDFTYKVDSFKQVKWGDVIAVDIETHGVDNEVIDLVSLSDTKTTLVFNWSEAAREYMTKVFALPGRLFAIHNSQFDIPRLMGNGVEISEKVLDTQVFDTMMAAVILQPDLHKALGRVASLYLDLSPWKTSSRNEASPWRAMVNSDPLTYAAKDAFVTAWIARQEIQIMKADGCWNLAMGQGGHPGPGVMATMQELQRMTDGGLRLDKAGTVAWCERLERKALRYQKIWTRLFPTVNAGSSPQLCKLFYKEWGLPVQYGQKESTSVDELALVKLASFVEHNKGSEIYPGEWHTDPRCTPRLFELLLRMRDIKMTLKTYVEKALFSESTWVHPQYLPVSKDEERDKKKKANSKGNTATGRLSASNPNIQNQPKKVRRLYVPDTDEMCFVEADLKSAELYVQAYMSGDQLMIADLAQDIHSINANLLGIDRKPTKNVTYASQYLATPTKQSEMILQQTDDHMYVSPAECFAISNGIWSRYSDAQAFKQHLISMCETKKFIVNPFGRIRYFHDGRAAAAVNFIPQSVVADMIWCMIKPLAVFLRSLGGRLVTTVHDSFLACVPASRVREAAEGMRRIMEQPFDCVAPGFHIPVEIKVGAPGASWGHLMDYKEAA